MHPNASHHDTTVSTHALCSHLRYFVVLVLFGRYTGQRTIATAKKLTIGQFRHALCMEKSRWKCHQKPYKLFRILLGTGLLLLIRQITGEILYHRGSTGPDFLTSNKSSTLYKGGISIMRNLLKKTSQQVSHLCRDVKSILLLLWALPTYYKNGLIKWLPAYYEDGLITWQCDDFMKDEWFVACYDSAVSAGLAVADKIHWRVHTLCWAALRGKELEGDFIECGVNKGFCSKITADYVGFKQLQKTFFLMDTYEGLSAKYSTENELKFSKLMRYESCYEEVKNTFKDYANVKIIRGAIPDTLHEVTSEKIAYLSIDMNCVIPEIAAVEYFWDKLVAGATIVLDDYGGVGHEEQKYAFNEFAKRKDVPILCLPTGQGLIIKP